MTKSHPFLFTAWSVRRILSGDKTHTRRPITRMNTNVDGHGRVSQEFWDGFDFDKAWVDPGPSPAGNPGPYLKVPHKDGATHRLYPWWQAGDVLWGRETIFYEWPTEEPPDDMQECRIVYHATEPDYITSEMREFSEQYRWTPSIFMPKWACRLWLPVERVWPERINSISADDCRAEGLDPKLTDIGARYSFGILWNSIYAKKGFGWETNCYVWATEFRRSDEQTG